MLLLNNIILIYQGSFSPLISRTKNRIELMNEVFIQVTTLHIVIFTDFVPDQEAQYLAGFSMIIFLALCTIANCSYILKFGFRSLYLIVKKVYRMIKFKLCK